MLIDDFRPGGSRPSIFATMIDRALRLYDTAEQHVRIYFARGPARRVLWAVGEGLMRDRVTRAASAMSFDLFLAVVPTLALAGEVFAALLRKSPNAVASTSLLLDVSPEQVHVLLDSHFHQFSGAAIAPVAIVSSLWLISGALHTCIAVFEVAENAERRPWWRKRMLAMGCSLVGIVAVALTGWLAVVLSGGPVALLRRFGHEAETGRYLALLVGSLEGTALLAAFFRIAVRRPGVERRVWPGAFATVLIGATESWIFGHYAPGLAKYTLFYGSLAAVAILLIWIWLWCAAVLIGAELNAVLEGVSHQASIHD